MKGHVPTPESIVDQMVAALFEGMPPSPDDTLLDPGCGDGPFMLGVLRYCDKNNLKPPHIVGVELNPTLAEAARKAIPPRHHDCVEVRQKDYLLDSMPRARYVIGNPPYVSITGLEEEERDAYRRRFKTAEGRFDLYALFFERSLGQLQPDGRLAFITPEKFEYVESTRYLRTLLRSWTLSRIEHVPEDTFPGRVTYPSITLIDKTRPRQGTPTIVATRDGQQRQIELPTDGRSWNAAIHASADEPAYPRTLGDVTIRVSCGVATGADSTFVIPESELPDDVRPFAHPTISGRQLGDAKFTDDTQVVATSHVMLTPYDSKGRLLPQADLGALGTYLSESGAIDHLKARTCVRGDRPWHRFHDNVPLPDLNRSKILCKDIAPEPRFWLDASGDIIPKHSAYYIVPRDGVNLERLADYLNSEPARAWLKARCQRAANGFYRLQSRVLRDLPVPESVLDRPAPVSTRQQVLSISSS